MEKQIFKPKISGYLGHSVSINLNRVPVLGEKIHFTNHKQVGSYFTVYEIINECNSRGIVYKINIFAE